VGFVVDKVALGQAFSEYFGFPCQSSSHQLLHNHHHLSSAAGTIGQQWPTYQVDSVSPHPEKLKKILRTELLKLSPSWHTKTIVMRENFTLDIKSSENLGCYGKQLTNVHMPLLLNLQENGPIRHVETCPDFFFSLQEYTQQNPLSKF
jgi:hypothetical protein